MVCMAGVGDWLTAVSAVGFSGLKAGSPRRGVLAGGMFGEGVYFCYRDRVRDLHCGSDCACVISRAAYPAGPRLLAACATITRSRRRSATLRTGLINLSRLTTFCVPFCGKASSLPSKAWRGNGVRFRPNPESASG
jgi:hypothetical protein